MKTKRTRHKEKFIIKCGQCGNEFVGNYNERNRKFCSSECYYKSRVGKYVGVNGGNYQGGKVEFICKECGNSILDYSKTKRVFCSRRCRSDWLSKNNRGENNPLHGRKLTKERCQEISENQTGEKNYWHKSNGNMNINAIIAMTTANTGRKKPLKERIKISASLQGISYDEWKKFSDKQSITLSPDYIHWRNLIYKRDNYICQMCYIKNRKLHAHHILPNRDYPEFIFNIDNGITLCPKCHYKTFNKEYEFVYKFSSIIIENKLKIYFNNIGEL